MIINFFKNYYLPSKQTDSLQLSLFLTYIKLLYLIVLRTKNLGYHNLKAGNIKCLAKIGFYYFLAQIPAAIPCN